MFSSNCVYICDVKKGVKVGVFVQQDEPGGHISPSGLHIHRAGVWLGSQLGELSCRVDLNSTIHLHTLIFLFITLTFKSQNIIFIH